MSWVCLMLPAVTAASTDCDRECLKGFITKYLNAMIARKLDSLPLADTVRMTEDSKR